MRQTKDYNDIIDLKRPESAHPKMSMLKRAAQFSPFAALSGYEDIVKETARLTDHERTIQEWEKELLNRKLNLIADLIKSGEHPVITITYFEPDKYKSGGKYVTITEEVKKIDSVFRKVLMGELNIEIDKIADICGEAVDFLDEM